METETQVTPVTPATPMTLIQTAVNRGASIDEISKLLDLQQRWEAAEARKAFSAAFAKFKSEAIAIVKKVEIHDGPLRGKRYADLAAVVDAVIPALSRHGLSHSWKVSKSDKDWLEVTCTLQHVGGHSESACFDGPVDSGGAKNAIQARASTINYLQRYSLLAITGLAARGEDDDGRQGKVAVEPDPAGQAALEACGSMEELQATWKSLTAAQRKTLGGIKDECKQRIQDAAK